VIIPSGSAVRRGLLFSAFALGLLSAGPAPARAQSSCLPQWRAQQAVARPAIVNATARVFIDASGSMSGFLTSTRDQTFIELIYSVQGAAEAVASDLSYFRFGSKVEKIPPDQFLMARRKDFFTGPISQWSHITDAVSQINAAPTDQLGIVVTDLFLSAGDNPNAVNAPLREQLAATLRSGRSVAVIGLKSAFDGALTDLATTKDSVPFRGADRKRAIYVLLLGPRHLIDEFYTQLKSRMLTGKTPDAVRLALFSKALADGGQTLTAPAASNQISLGGRVSPTNDPVAQNLKIPAFVINRQGGFIDVKFNESALGVSPLAQFQLKVNAGVYLRQPPGSGGTCPTWSDRDDAEAQMRLDPPGGCGGKLSPGEHCLRFEPRTDWFQNLPRKLPFLLSIAVSVEPTPLPPAWFDEWGYAPQKEIELLRTLPPFFPTLNLDRLGAVLHDLTKARGDRSGGGQFLTYVSFEKD
jgi:hypothetical protein